MRKTQADVDCATCGQPLIHDEVASLQAARPVHVCPSCQTMSGTVRMRVVKNPVPQPNEALALAELPVGMSVALEVTDGPHRGSVHRLRRRVVVVGREEGEIRITDPGISRRHASIEVLDMDTVILRDLSSTNGTYHNDQLIAFCKVQDGDEIRIGATTLTVSIDLLG